MSSAVSISIPVDLAALEYLGRRDRARSPVGACDKGGRWFPSDEERQACCVVIRSPSRGWPWSLLKHCSTAEHVAQLFDVDALELKRRARELDQLAKPKAEGGAQ
ncbi:hypothetical protein [Roseateles sp.]|uniref:hypothetical protein n=1 Tax=Roseateles sp. TaxID=1971397 RepID=UPI0031E296C7